MIDGSPFQEVLISIASDPPPYIPLIINQYIPVINHLNSFAKASHIITETTSTPIYIVRQI